MLKKIVLISLLSFMALFKAQENQVADLLHIPGSIELNGTEYFLVWSKQASNTLFRQQYLPRDEKIEDFNQILDFSYFNKEIDIELAVRQKVESIQHRQEKDKYAKANVSESPDGKEYIVDYFISESPKDGTPYIEYNIYRFRQYEKGEQKSFLILNYGKRSYGDLRTGSKFLNKQRDVLMTAMIDFKIPEIKVVAAP